MSMQIKLKKMFNIVSTLLTVMLILSTMESCSTTINNNITDSVEYCKKVQEVCHSKNGTGLTDFGDYLIWIDDFKSADLESAVSYAQIVSDNTEGGLCTACVK